MTDYPSRLNQFLNAKHAETKHTETNHQPGQEFGRKSPCQESGGKISGQDCGGKEDCCPIFGGNVPGSEFGEKVVSS